MLNARSGFNNRGVFCRYLFNCVVFVYLNSNPNKLTALFVQHLFGFIKIVFIFCIEGLFPLISFFCFSYLNNKLNLTDS